MKTNPLRQLPAVNEVLESPDVQALLVEFAHDVVVAAVREELDELRKQIRQGQSLPQPMGVEDIADRVRRRLVHELSPKLRSVINATGIVLHTNLGRAPIAEPAAQAAYEAARGYLNLELDLETGKRSSRQNAIREWVARLTGAESATVVNNNAAATVLVLRSLCAGREVIISRGQLIEIGGSFRIPEIMAVSGATLREVGTTNITRIADYERAITDRTAALMQVHTSNYRISGFTKSASLAELVELGKRRGLLVIDDIGSGALIDFSRFGFEHEPVARDSIAAGADLVLFSGDKLLGGPQAGIIAGKKQLIQTIEKDPLMRAFRTDKMTLAALEATLRLYLSEAQALSQIPGLCMLGMDLNVLRKRAERLAAQLRQIKGLSCQVNHDIAYVGGGSLPDQAMKTVVIEIEARQVSDGELAHRLRIGTPSVVGRLRDGKLVLDLRTVFERQLTELVEAIRSAVSLAEPPQP